MPPASTLDVLLATAPNLSVGILTANLMSLGTELALLESTPVKLLHVDVMDGCFVPPLTVGPALIKALRSPLLKDVHLMIREPLDKIPEYVRAGADIITVHYESGNHIHRVLQSLTSYKNANDPARGIVRGLALNPGTTLAAVEYLLDEVDLLLLLAVNPGWGGQSFIEATRTKIVRARDMIRASGRRVVLGVDGGITRANLPEIAATGVDLIVTGSAVFDGKAPAENAVAMLNVLKTAAPNCTKSTRRENDAKPLV